jgi:hypothetical protein
VYSKRDSSRETGPLLTVPRHSPLQGPHGFDRVGCRIAHSPRDRLVTEILDVLQIEFASRGVGADLLGDAVMLNQASAIQQLRDGFGKERRQISRAPLFPARVVQGSVQFYLRSGFGFQPLPHCTGFLGFCRPQSQWRLSTRSLAQDCLERDANRFGAEFARYCFSKRLDDPFWIDAAARPYLIYQRIAKHECLGKSRDIGDGLIQVQHLDPEVSKPAASREFLIGSMR